MKNRIEARRVGRGIACLMIGWGGLSVGWCGYPLPIVDITLTYKDGFLLDHGRPYTGHRHEVYGQSESFPEDTTARCTYEEGRLLRRDWWSPGTTTVTKREDFAYEGGRLSRRMETSWWRDGRIFSLGIYDEGVTGPDHYSITTYWPDGRRSSLKTVAYAQGRLSTETCAAWDESGALAVEEETHYGATPDNPVVGKRRVVRGIVVEDTWANPFSWPAGPAAGTIRRAPPLPVERSPMTLRLTTGTWPVVLPFEVTYDGSVVVPGVFHGRPIKWMMNSAMARRFPALMAPTVKDAELSRNIFGWPWDPQPLPQKMVTLDRMAIGSIEFTGMEAIPLPLEAPERYTTGVMEAGVFGVLGREWFQSLVIRVDYGRRTLTLTPTDQFRGDEEAGVPIPLAWSGEDLPTIPALVGGQLVRLAVYSWNGFAAVLYKNSIDPARWTGLVGPPYGGVPNRLEDGTELRTLTALTVGPVSLTAIPCLVRELGKQGGDVNGEVGNGFWRRFVVTFDVSHGTLWLAPAKDRTAVEREEHWRAGRYALASSCTAESQGYLKAGKFREALSSAHRALEAEPPESPGYSGRMYDLAWVNRCAEQYPEAVAVCREMIKTNPYDARPWHVIGDIHLAQQKIGEAVEVYQNALAIHPRDARALAKLGLAHLDQVSRLPTLEKKLPWLSQGMEALRKALSLVPEMAEARVYLAWGLAELGEHVLALEHLERVLRANPTDELALTNAGLSKYRLGFYAEALGYWQQLKEHHPGSRRAEEYIRMAETALTGEGSPDP